MKILVDTNILGRLSQPEHSHYILAKYAIHNLQQAGHELRIVPQALYEYWVIATKSVRVMALDLAWNKLKIEFANFNRSFKFSAMSEEFLISG